ncbi:hypothetical protein Tco_1135371 [Tanacetum coccineum]
MALGYQNPFYLKQASWKTNKVVQWQSDTEKHDPHVVHDSEEDTGNLLKEIAAKFVRDCKSLAKRKLLNLLLSTINFGMEFERLLRAVVSQEFCLLCHYPSVVDSSKSPYEHDIATVFNDKGSVRFSALYLKKKRNLLVFSSVDMIVMTSMVELESIFGHLFDELSNGENQVVSKSSAVTTADASDKCQQQQDSTSSTSTLATAITADGNFDL